MISVKIDTKEKFHVLKPQEPILSANMTEDFEHLLLSHLHKEVKNVILNLEAVQTIEPEVAEMLQAIQQQFYDQAASFVICDLQPQVEEWLDGEGLLEIMNTTPTESEAWDIVQMEEIEREILGDE